MIDSPGRIYFALATLISFTLASCYVLPCMWDYGYTPLKLAPPQKKIVGTYLLTEESLKFLKKKGFQHLKYELRLNENGQYHFSNTPDLLLLNSWGSTNCTVLNKEGKWSVTCGDSYDCLIELEGICVVPFSEGDKTFAIPIEIGDPDNCEGIIYEKRQ